MIICVPAWRDTVSMLFAIDEIFLKLLPDQTSYSNCIVSPTMKVEDAINKGVECTVSPNRYIDEKGLWVNQKQVIKFSSKVQEFKGINYVKI